MRIIAIPLSALAVVVTISAQESFQPPQPDTGVFYLPVSVSKTVRAERTHPGDKIPFRLDAAVLVGHGVVMPQGAKLTGHVTEARSLDGEQSSRLGILVDSAEWRGHTVPLRAFISGIITVRMVSHQAAPPCQSLSDSIGTSSRSGDQTAIPPEASGRECNGGVPGLDESSVLERGAELRGLLLRQNRADNSTMLLSHKKNIHLPGGTLLMLKNVPVLDDAPGTLISHK